MSSTIDQSLMVDESRVEWPETGIYVRARSGPRWGSHDIAHLDRQSLFAWLRSGGGANLLAENTLLLLLGHEPFTERPDDPKAKT